MENSGRSNSDTVSVKIGMRENLTRTPWGQFPDSVLWIQPYGKLNKNSIKVVRLRLVLPLDFFEQGFR